MEGDPIDYRDVAARFSFAEHAQRADQYFAGSGTTSTLARKPFATMEEAAELCSAIGTMLAGLNLFPGVRVLEFGAGSCWFSRILALLRCEVVAVDVSANALELGRRLMAADPLAADLRVEFVRLESDTLPFPDESFDRVLCFDALHHVWDQSATVAEFARVLKAPGVIGLHEPGPDHSRGAQSQYEMRKFNVIEGDVHIEQLIDRARQHGIVDVKMAAYSTRPVFVELSEFNQFLATPTAGAVTQAMNAQAHADFQNRRVCFMHKGDPSAPMDSRRRDGLRMEFAATAERNPEHIRIRGQVLNTGDAIWLPSSTPIDGTGKAGDVNIGVHLVDLDGTQHSHYYARRALSSTPVHPGESVHVDFTLPNPAAQRFRLEIDLVAEHVSWFETAGSMPYHIEINTGPTCRTKHG